MGRKYGGTGFIFMLQESKNLPRIPNQITRNTAWERGV